MMRTTLDATGARTEWVRINMVRDVQDGAPAGGDRRAKAGENARWRAPARPSALVLMLA